MTTLHRIRTTLARATWTDALIVTGFGWACVCAVVAMAVW